MLNKLGFDTACEKCHAPKMWDEIADGENGFCHDCVDEAIYEFYTGKKSTPKVDDRSPHYNSIISLEAMK